MDVRFHDIIEELVQSFDDYVACDEKGSFPDFIL